MEPQLQQNEVDSIQADVIELIARQRLLRLVEGGKFLKCSPKGQIIKDKYWFCRLSPNHRTFHYGDTEDGKELQLEELPNKISVSDVKNVLIGKDCPHTKEGYMKKNYIDLAFTIVYISDHDDYLNFLAKDHKTFCHWTDGLNALLKNSMISEEFQKDLHILSKVESRMRSMNK